MDGVAGLSDRAGRRRDRAPRLVRFPRAAWHGPVPNVSPGPIRPRLVVIHIMSGTLDGTDAWFHNPTAKVSAHFGTGKDGQLVEWVDGSDKAWAEAAYNSEAISVENEGHSGDSLTGPQLEQNAQVLAWAHSTFGVPLGVAATPKDGGLIGHGQLGATGGNHPDCPGGPIVAQFPQIVARAAQIVGTPTPTPNPVPVVEDDDMARVAVDPATGDFWVLNGPDGSLGAYEATGLPGRRYYGNLLDHAEYNAGPGKPEGAAFDIAFWPQGAGLPGLPPGGYVIFTRDPAGGVHPFHFDANTIKAAA